MNDPFQLFEDWYAEALQDSPLKHPEAVCVSTVSADGTPQTRFVALKNVSESGFVFCSSLTSPKAQQIQVNQQVALTFWWDHIERQVRVNGVATLLSDDDAEYYFQARSRDAQLSSLVSEPSAVLEDYDDLKLRLREADNQFLARPIPRPDWGGYCVKPERIEFLSFAENRLHERVLFVLEAGEWQKTLLQP